MRPNRSERLRFRFSHRGMDNRYYWESTTQIPGDSRVETISCSAAWFWNGSGTEPPEPIRHAHDCWCGYCRAAAMGGGR
jgi:hypothetical protein